MKYFYCEHCEVEKAFYVFKLLEYSGYIPINRPLIEPNGCFWVSNVEFPGKVDSKLIAKINDIPGVSFVSI